MTTDLVVVGAGTMGAWTARRGQQAGLDVTLIDAYGAGNSRATSGDETRIIRSSLRAGRAVRDLGAWRRATPGSSSARETGETLYVPCGTIWFAHHEDGFEATSAATLSRLGIRVERLTPAEVAERWPQITSSDLLFAAFEPDGGLLMARRGVAAVARRFVAEGGRFELGWAKPGRADGRRLLDVETGDGARHVGRDLRLRRRAVAAAALPRTAGRPHQGHEAGRRLRRPDRRRRAVRRADGMPCFVDYDAAFYGIPSVEGRGFKLAPDRYGPVFDPSTGERLVDPESVRLARRYLAERLPGLADAPVVETRICQYETTPDTHFIIDRHPDYDNVWIAGGGSGHAFKHGPVIGRYVIERIGGAPTGPERRPLQPRPRPRAEAEHAHRRGRHGRGLVGLVSRPSASPRARSPARTVESGKTSASSADGTIQSTSLRLTISVPTSRATTFPATE